MSITFADVSQAVERIASRVRVTPVLRAETETVAQAGTVWFKCEFTQHTGSFKARGAFNRILAARERGELTDTGVVAASGGNAGLAVAYAARQLAVPATVYVPQTAPQVKVAKLRRLGATVHMVGSEYAQAYDAALAAVDRGGALFCHAYDQPEICAGQGSLAVELRDQLPHADTVLVAVGGGGLMAGIVAGLDGAASVVAVEPRTAATLHTALERGAPVDVPVSGIAADSLGARRIGDIAFHLATTHEIHSVLVGDADITAARRLLWDQYRLVVEPGAATALAALTSGAYRPRPQETVAVILCGANTDPSDLSG